MVNFDFNSNYFQPPLPPLMRRDMESSQDAARFLAGDRMPRDFPLTSPEAHWEPGVDALKRAVASALLDRFDRGARLRRLCGQNSSWRSFCRTDRAPYPAL